MSFSLFRLSGKPPFTATVYFFFIYNAGIKPRSLRILGEFSAISCTLSDDIRAHLPNQPGTVLLIHSTCPTCVSRGGRFSVRARCLFWNLCKAVVLACRCYMIKPTDLAA